MIVSYILIPIVSLILCCSLARVIIFTNANVKRNLKYIKKNRSNSNFFAKITGLELIQNKLKISFFIKLVIYLILIGLIIIFFILVGAVVWSVSGDYTILKWLKALTRIVNLLFLVIFLLSTFMK